MSTHPPSPLPSFARAPERASWQQALRDAVRTTQELLELLELDPGGVDGFQPNAREFPLLVPRGFVARMRKGDARDPLLLQVLPDSRELSNTPGFTRDPLQESSLARGGVLRKYPGRALLIATAACPVHCRYCFRRHFPYAQQRASTGEWSRALGELRRSPPDTREVIVSGGDPLTLSNRPLRRLVAALETVDGVDTLRIHSRFPIVLPERVDRGLLEILRDTRLRTVLVIHSNHGNEIDATVQDALLKLRTTGTVLLNQSVLLRGINDDPGCLETLSHRLFDCGVLPYYLHQLDPVAGAAHYEVEASRGRALMMELRRRLPGYLVPKLVKEIPGELSKTPV